MNNPDEMSARQDKSELTFSIPARPYPCASSLPITATNAVGRMRIAVDYLAELVHQHPLGAGLAVAELRQICDWLRDSKLSGKTRCTNNEAVDFCLSLALPATDGEWFYAKMCGNGWKNGGQAVKDWRATIRAWRVQGYMPSQKRGVTAGGALTVSDKIGMRQEYDRVLNEMKIIEGTYSGHQDMRSEDRIRLRELRARQTEIKKALGIVA